MNFALHRKHYHVDFTATRALNFLPRICHSKRAWNRQESLGSKSSFDLGILSIWHLYISFTSVALETSRCLILCIYLCLVVILISTLMERCAIFPLRRRQYNCESWWGESTLQCHTLFTQTDVFKGICWRHGFFYWQIYLRKIKYIKFSMWYWEFLKARSFWSLLPQWKCVLRSKY